MIQASSGSGGVDRKVVTISSDVDEQRVASKLTQRMQSQQSLSSKPRRISKRNRSKIDESKDDTTIADLQNFVNSKLNEI